MQLTMCEMCGDKANAIDHRLSITVAKSLGYEAELRAFTLANLRWLRRRCHRRKTRQDRILARTVNAVEMNWRSAQEVTRVNRRWVSAFTLPFSINLEASERMK